MIRTPNRRRMSRRERSSWNATPSWSPKIRPTRPDAFPGSRSSGPATRRRASGCAAISPSHRARSRKIPSNAARLCRSPTGPTVTLTAVRPELRASATARGVNAASSSACGSPGPPQPSIRTLLEKPDSPEDRPRPASQRTPGAATTAERAAAARRERRVHLGESARGAVFVLLFDRRGGLSFGLLDVHQLHVSLRPHRLVPGRNGRRVESLDPLARVRQSAGEKLIALTLRLGRRHVRIAGDGARAGPRIGLQPEKPEIKLERAAE